jgi:hypothetical protein
MLREETGTMRSYMVIGLIGETTGNTLRGFGVDEAVVSVWHEKWLDMMEDHSSQKDSTARTGARLMELLTLAQTLVSTRTERERNGARW